MMINNDKPKKCDYNQEALKKTQKKIKNISVIEYEPVYDIKEKQERNQYVTQRCIELLKLYK